MKKTLLTVTMAAMIGMGVVACGKKEAPAAAPAQTAAANSTAIITGANCGGRDAENTIQCLEKKLATC